MVKKKNLLQVDVYGVQPKNQISKREEQSDENLRSNCVKKGKKYKNQRKDR